MATRSASILGRVILSQVKISIVKIGKPSLQEYGSIVEQFQKRLKSYSVSHLEIRSLSCARKMSALLEQRLGLGESRKPLQDGHLIIMLDERGSHWSSIQLSEKVKEWQLNPRIKRISFIIGGPYGISEEIKKSCDLLWSLSTAVFPSDLAWVIVWEQVYRAFSIIKGTSYHHQ